MLGLVMLDNVKQQLISKSVALSGDETYRVRKASRECLVGASRALGVSSRRIHFGMFGWTGT